MNKNRKNQLLLWEKILKIPYAELKKKYKVVGGITGLAIYIRIQS